MSKIGKIILWTLVIAVLSIFIYFSLKKEQVFGFSFGPGFDFLENYEYDFNSFKDSVSGKGKEAASSLKTYFNKETDGLKNEVDKSKGTIFGIVEESLNKTENMAGEILGVKSNPAADGFGLLTESIAYLTKINAPLFFIIKNHFNQTEQKEINYQIDWGDGQKENGNLKEGQSKTISRSWSKEGEYTVRFKITDGLENLDYRFKVSVVK